MTNKTVEIRNMYKVYKKKTGGTTMAVKGTFLDVFEGECFGLLGTNGAGKTTTFKIMCGELAPSYGSVKILDEVMPYNLDKVRQYMGYCPQFDALLTKLTSQEHIELFCHLKGIDPKYHKYLIETTLKNLNLLKYRNVNAGTYSGGNKRKLNVAIALLGKPPIVFLDEPSSGMDPEARRFMWTVINNITNVQKKSSIVLTTHSMEEAEALTNRLAIMVSGRIKVMGNVQTIKNVYGDAFEIDVGKALMISF
jgi:ATP-binding cassette subfamily A (ABC1) protein 3